jgi:hypothetical protein
MSVPFTPVASERVRSLDRTELLTLREKVCSTSVASTPAVLVRLPLLETVPARARDKVVWTSAPSTLEALVRDRSQERVPATARVRA